MLHEIEIDFTHPGMQFLAAIAVIIIVYMLYLSALKGKMSGTSAVSFNNNSTGLNNGKIPQGPDGIYRAPVQQTAPIQSGDFSAW